MGGISRISLVNLLLLIAFLCLAGGVYLQPTLAVKYQALLWTAGLSLLTVFLIWIRRRSNAWDEQADAQWEATLSRSGEAGLPEADREAVMDLLERMDSADEAEQQAAGQELEQMGAQALAPLGRLLREAARERTRADCAVAMGVGGFVLAVFFLLLAAFRVPFVRSIPSWLLAGLMPLAVSNGLTSYMLFRTSRQTRLRITRRLAALEDVRAVGPLAEALEIPDVRREARDALITLLPRLRATDAPCLTARQRECLHRALQDPALTRPVLAALEQVGDASALPVVERLARAARDPGVREVAQDCLLALRQRAAQTLEERTLLRPADAPGTPAATLLRPAQGAGATDPATLLRPVGPPAGSEEGD